MTLLADSTGKGLFVPENAEGFYVMLGTLVALFLPIVTEWLKQRSAKKRRPVLSIDFAKHEETSSWTLTTVTSQTGQTTKERFWIRVPVQNAREKDPATNVEFFIESISTSNPTYKPTAYLPVRCQWTNLSNYVCDRISGGAYRLLDFATLGEGRVQLTLRTEGRDITLSAGNYIVTFLIVFGGGDPMRESWELEVFNNDATTTNQSSHFVKFEKLIEKQAEAKKKQFKK